MKRCEAAAMDAAHFGNWDAPRDWCPPCDQSAAVERQGYWLCRGCDEALGQLGSLGAGLAVRRAEAVVAAGPSWTLLLVAAGLAVIGMALVML